MDQSERKFIAENLPRLLKLITWNICMESMLRSMNSSSDPETQNLGAIIQPSEKVAAFLKIMQEQDHGYNKLIYILKESKQSRAVNLLEEIRLQS